MHEINDDQALKAALQRLSREGRAAEGGWIPRDWTRIQGDTKQPLEMTLGNVQLRPAGMFEELSLRADEGLSLLTRLDLPALLHGAPITGEPLQLTVNSLRPVDVFRDDARVFGDRLPIVASGPALIELVHSAEPGDNGELRIDVLPTRTPLDGEWASFGLTLHLTTPSVRERFRVLDLAHARLLLAASFASTKAERAAVHAAAECVPSELEAMPTPALISALGASGQTDGMSKHLAWLDAALSDYRIHCVGHSHIDLAWLWTYEDTRNVILRDFRSVISLFEDYPEFRFTHSQARGYAEVESTDPALFGRVKELIREGRLEPATMQWVEADANLPSGLAHTQQIVEGVTYTQTSLEAEPHVFLAPDTFGHSGNLPQLAKQAGATTYYHHRANPGFSDGEGCWPAYWWIGDDGTRLLTVGTPVYLGPVTATHLANDLISLGKAKGLTDVCYFYGVGDHGGGPTREDLEAIRALEAASLFPSVSCATVSDFADAVLASGVTLPEFRGESDRVFEGCYITHADGKKMNRLAENALTTAGTLASIAGTGKARELKSAWRKALHQQFHDILGGSAVAPVFDDQRDDLADLLSAAREVADRAMRELSWGTPAGSWVITNPTALRQRDAVSLDTTALSERGFVRCTANGMVNVETQEAWSGGRVFVAELPGLGSAEYRATEEKAPSATGGPVASGPNATGEYEVDTHYFRAVFSGDSGIITDLVLKPSGTVVVGRGPVSPESRRQLRPDLGWGALVITHELPHGMSAWVADRNDREETLMSGAETRIIEQGPVRVVFESRHLFGNSGALLRTMFYNSLPWVDYELEVDWQEVGSRTTGIPGLALSFSTRMPARDFWTESPFSVVRRNPDGYLVPALRWVDLGSEDGGITLANDGKYGVEALGPRLRVHVLRSAYEPDPQSDAGRVDVSRYRLHPHLGPWQDADTVALASALNQPIVAYEVAGTEPATHQTASDQHALRPRIQPDTSSIILAAMETVEDGVLLRLYESRGVAAKATLVGLGDRQAIVTDLLGRPIEPERPARAPMGLEMNPFEVRTVRVV